VVVRFYTASSAMEYAISPLELRRRYPHSGLVCAPEDCVDVDPAVKPVSFDIKGRFRDGRAGRWVVY